MSLVSPRVLQRARCRLVAVEAVFGVVDDVDEGVAVADGHDDFAEGDEADVAGDFYAGIAAHVREIDRGDVVELLGDIGFAASEKSRVRGLGLRGEGKEGQKADGGKEGDRSRSLIG